MNESDLNSFSAFLQIFTLGKVIILVVGFVIIGLLTRFLNQLADRLTQRIPSKRLLIAQTVTTLTFLIYIVGGGYFFYGVLRPPQSLILATSGTLAVAFGLSLKDLVSSMVAGIILLFDRPFQVGDRVSFGGVYGEISSIGLRATRLITLDDSVVTIPNSRFITDIVSSGNLGALDMMIENDFILPIDSNLVKAKEILYETAVTSKFVFLKKPVSIVVNQVQALGRPMLQFKVKCYVIDVKLEKALQTDIFIRGYEKLKEGGIRLGESVPLSFFDKSQENLFRV